MSVLLEVLLNAAALGSYHLEDYCYALDDVSDRNEQRTTSYVGTLLNDYLRRIYGQPDGVQVTYEQRVSWMDDSTGVTTVDDDILKSAQRFDAAAWNADSIVGLLEVKNAPGQDRNGLALDAKRIERALGRWGKRAGGTLEWGAYLFSVRLTKAESTMNNSSSLHTKFERRLELIESALVIEPKSRFKVVKDTADCCLGWGAVLLA